MRLRFWRAEHRASYTDTLAEALAAAAAGSVGPQTTQARRTASSAWAAVLASADVAGAPPAVSARYLANVGERLIRDGSSTHEIRIVDGSATLDPVTVTKRDPWRIRRTGADRDAPIARDALVVHDWADGGLGPWHGTADAATALALQLSLLAESRIVSFRALPADWNLTYQQLAAQGDPDSALQAVADSLRSATKNAHSRGSPIIVSTGGVPGAPNVDARASQRRPSDYYEMAATRAEPDEDAVQLRTDVEATMLAACGLSREYSRGDVDAVRAFRQLWVAPRLALMAAELSEQLDASVRLTLPAFDRDLQGLARGAAALMRGDVDADRALRLMGLEDAA